MKLYFPISLLLFLTTSRLYGQKQDSLLGVYQFNIPLHQEIVSGGYYADSPLNFEGDPYFISRNFGLGNLIVNQITYSNVPLLYNIHQDDIITFHPDHEQKVRIKPDKINGFILLKSTPLTFVKINENPGYLHHNNGFYELVAAGQANLLCKHYKNLKKKRDNKKYLSEFVEKWDYWVQKNGTLQQIRKKKDIVEFLELDKKETRKMAKEKNTVYSFDKRGYLLLIVSHYNQGAH